MSGSWNTRSSEPCGAGSVVTNTGVLASWRPRVRMYDITGDQYSEPESVYMPFNWIEPMEIRTSANNDNWKPMEGNPTYLERLHNSETSFIQTATSPTATYRHRIFIVEGEIPFAGHPSLGTAAV